MPYKVTRENIAVFVKSIIKCDNGAVVTQRLCLLTFWTKTTSEEYGTGFQQNGPYQLGTCSFLTPISPSMIQRQTLKTRGLTSRMGNKLTISRRICEQGDRMSQRFVFRLLNPHTISKPRKRQASLFLNSIHAGHILLPVLCSLQFDHFNWSQKDCPRLSGTLRNLPV